MKRDIPAFSLDRLKIDTYLNHIWQFGLVLFPHYFWYELALGRGCSLSNHIHCIFYELLTRLKDLSFAYSVWTKFEEALILRLWSDSVPFTTAIRKSSLGVIGNDFPKNTQ